MFETVNDCVFCDIVTGEKESEVVFETTDYLCIRDKYPVTDGHASLFLKKHVESLEAAEWGSLTAVLKDAISSVRSQTTPDGLNVRINDVEAAGQTIPHVHWHMIPRYESDVENPTGGVRGVIPERRHYDME